MITGWVMTNARGTPWRHYLELTKPKVIALVLFTALTGMLLSIEGPPSWLRLIAGLLGIGFAAAAGAVFNHVAEVQTDALMERTRTRPLPSGRVDAMHAIGFGIVLSTLSMALLISFNGVLAAALTLLSLVGYALFYTLYLKRTTPQNIVWGGAAGAAPPLLGWCAMSGSVSMDALLLFLIVFVWTPPHFWPLAVHRRDDYARARLPMLPVTHGVAFTKQQVFIYSLMLLAVTLLPFVLGQRGLLYLATASALGIGFVVHAWRLLRSDIYAMRTFRYSIVYLAGLFAALLVDHWANL